MWPLLAAIALPLVGGSLSARQSMSDTTGGDWKSYYDALNKPPYTPPVWAYGVAWTVLYVLMGIASYIAFEAGAGPVAIGMYALQLGLNVTWSPMFFQRRNLRGAALISIALVGAVAGTIAAFAHHDTTAAALLLPYLVWAIFAAVLATDIWERNKMEYNNTTS